MLTCSIMSFEQYLKILAHPVFTGLNFHMPMVIDLSYPLVMLKGENGSGKSTLANAIIGRETYETSGSIKLNNNDLLLLNVTDRAKAGIFMTFQTPPSIPGITNFKLVNNFPKSFDTLKLLSKYKKDMLKLQLGQCWNQRNFNEGASGGERKKNELLQLLQSNPKVVILDELDTGLDVDALKIILQIINEHKDKYGWLVISHSSKVLKNLNPNYVHILQNGKINETGGADLLDKIEEKGFLNATK